MNNNIFPSVASAISYALSELRNFGAIHETESWQGIHQPVQMWEYDNLYFQSIMPESILSLQRQTKATQPWAENHFLERVAGKPLNPGNEYKNWPFYKDQSFNDQNFRNVEEKFTHTYMERYWPKHAGDKVIKSADLYEVSLTPVGYQPGHRNVEYETHKGIRYEYGDLNDVIKLLLKEPHTRQAYLPIWFPEDTGVLHGGRVPCSIGYHFIMRNYRLNIHYTIRACDAIRHFRNDIYLTIRLAQWVLNRLGAEDKNWADVKMGVLTMDIINFHTFAKEKNLI